MSVEHLALSTSLSYLLAFVWLSKQTSVLQWLTEAVVFVCIVLLSLVYREKKQYSITVQSVPLSFLMVVTKTTIVCKFWRLAFFENFFTGAIQQTPC